MKRIGFYGLLLLLVITLTTKAQNRDINLLKQIVESRNKKLDNSFFIVSKTGNLISAGIGLYGSGLMLFSHDSLEKIKGLHLATGIAASLIVTQGLKLIFNRNRPYQDNPQLDHFYEPISNSFPSASASLAFGTATSLSLVYRKWYFAFPAFVWASTIGYSRLHLGVHYPTDVLGGALVGIVSSYASLRINKWIQRKKRKPKKTNSYIAD